MKRILMISTDRKVFEVGSAVRKRLIEYGELTAGLEVIVFSLAKNGFRSIEIDSKVKIYPTNSKTRVGYILRAYFLGRKLTRPDLITCQDPFETGLAGWLLSRFWNCGLELQLHTDFLEPAFKEESWLNGLRSWLAKFILPKATQVRVVSERIKSSLVKADVKLKSEPIVLPIFVEEESSESGVDLHSAYPQFDKIILMTVRLTKEKRLDLALRSFALALKEKPNLGLVLAGSGPLMTVLKNLAKNLNIERNVVFTGWVNNLTSLYRSADCFLLTSAYEGYGLSLVEAALAGLPIVSTDVGVAKEVGAIIVAGKTEDIAMAIVKNVDRGKVVPPASLPMLTKQEYLSRLARAWQ